MEVIWRPWEHLRLEPALGVSTWWLNHADSRTCASSWTKKAHLILQETRAPEANLLALANNHNHFFDLGSQGIMATVDTAKQLNVTNAGTGKGMGSANAMQLLDAWRPGGAHCCRVRTFP
jgi:hypothetical protein